MLNRRADHHHSGICAFQDECYDLVLYDWKKVDLSDEVRAAEDIHRSDTATSDNTSLKRVH